jgi:hypothetical protein
LEGTRLAEPQRVPLPIDLAAYRWYRRSPAGMKANFQVALAVEVLVETATVAAGAGAATAAAVVAAVVGSAA